MGFYENLIADATRAAEASNAPGKMGYKKQKKKIKTQQEKRGSNRTWSEGQQQAQNEALAAINPINFFSWIGENWQAAIITLICILILTR